MSYIIYNNKLTENNITSITHTVSTGTVTANTNLVKIYDRSIINKYDYSTSTTGATHTYTIPLDSSSTFSGVGIFGISSNQLANLRFSFYFSAAQIYATTTVATVTRIRTVNNETQYDKIWVFDETSNCDEIRISYDQNSTDDKSVGVIYAGDSIDINIKPSSTKYDFKTSTKKDRSNGNQVYTNQGNTYMLASFTTTAEEETKVIDDYFNLNYISSISEPIIFFPKEGSSIVLYGTQSKLNSSKPVMTIKNNEWNYENSFSLEEEL